MVNVPFSSIVTMQDAAAATGNGTAAPTGDFALLACQVTGTFVGTITFEGTVDGTNYVSVEAINIATGAKATTATAAGIYRMGVSGLTLARARLTWTSGTSCTVVGYLTTAGEGELTGGVVGGRMAVVSANPVLTVAGAYSANDFVGTSATAISFANAVRISGGSGVIHAALLTDAAVQSASTELWLFDTAITPPADNAAWTLSDAHAATHIGVIPFTTYYASALNSVSLVRSVGLPFKALESDAASWLLS